jgi:uncharacterized protein with PIN domain
MDRSYRSHRRAAGATARSSSDAGGDMDGSSDHGLPSILVCLAAYRLNPGSSPDEQQHISRTVSAFTRQELLARAAQRCPPGARLVLLSWQDDLRIQLWRAESGWTHEAERPHPDYVTSNQLFKDLAVGDVFYEAHFLDSTIYWEKIGTDQARRTDSPVTKDLDPYATVHGC